MKLPAQKTWGVQLKLCADKCKLYDAYNGLVIFRLPVSCDFSGKPHGKNYITYDNNNLTIIVHHTTLAFAITPRK